MPDGQGQVSHFMLESAGRVEVLRGPFSALYGNSSGGVISVSSADPPPHPQLSAGLDAGNDGLQRASLSWHALWADGEGGVLVDGVREIGRANVWTTVTNTHLVCRLSLEKNK